MLNSIVAGAPVYLLVAARCLALVLTVPLFSTKAVPRIAKIAFVGYMAFFLFPQLSLSSGPYSAYSSVIKNSTNFSLEYIMLLIGEAMIGIIIGFFVNMIFAAFSTAGQFFAFQMGFTASEVFDSLSQVENPLMGQYFNIIATFVFISNHWFQTLFMGGLASSFKALNVFMFIENSNTVMSFLFAGLIKLFRDALIISLPIMGTLFLMELMLGIMSKVAPQMNLLSDSFPVLILSAFALIFILLPVLVQFFEDSFVQGFSQIQTLFTKLSGGGIN